MKYEVIIRLDFNKRPSRKDVNFRLWDHLRDKDIKYKMNKATNLKLVTIQGERYGAL